MSAAQDESDQKTLARARIAAIDFRPPCPMFTELRPLLIRYSLVGLPSNITYMIGSRMKTRPLSGGGRIAL